MPPPRPRQRPCRAAPPGARPASAPGAGARGHDAERSLAAAEQPGEVVARVVLEQTSEVGLDHLPGAEHRLHAEHLSAHRSVLHDVQPAGVRRHHPSDRRGVTSGQVDAERESVGSHLGLEGRERRTGPHRYLRGGGVDGADRVESPQVHDDLAGLWHGPPDQPRVPALRHQRDLVAARGADEGDDCPRRDGAEERRGCSPASVRSSRRHGFERRPDR